MLPLQSVNHIKKQKNKNKKHNQTKPTPDKPAALVDDDQK